MNEEENDIKEILDNSPHSLVHQLHSLGPSIHGPPLELQESLKCRHSCEAQGR